MKMHFAAGVLIILSACSAGGDLVSGSRAILELDKKYGEEAEALPSRRAPEMLVAYERNLSHGITPAGLSKLDDEDLKNAFDAAYSAAFYSEAEAPVLGMEAIVVELARRGLAAGDQIRQLYDAFVTARLWSKARLLRDAHPDLPPVPQIRESPAVVASGNRRVYEVSKGGKVLTLKELPWGSGPRIVMLTSPFCARSRSASADIDADPALRTAFAAHALRLNAPKLALSAEALGPGAYVAYRRADWPGLELGVTPIFYFYNEGRLLHKVDGWPSARRKSALIEGLKRIGIAPR